jgi:calpain-15
MWKIAKWLRPDQIKDMERNPAPWQVFRTPRPSDIHQGALGNCWFLSALAVMAEAPELVEQILVTKDYSSEGVYQVRLCKNGRWIIVTIDDLFPCTSSNNLVFSQARRKQLWVPLIEKGIAKLFGSYEALHAGTIQEGLSLLTGVACEEIEVGSFDAIEGQMIGDTDCELLWATLLSYKEAGFLVAAACGSKEGSDDTEEQMYVNHGLMPSHAYSVLDVKMIQQDVGKPLRLIRLRNPWGRFSWNGLWSDTSPVWRDFPQLRNDLMPCGAEEGIFWMQWDDFVRYFYRIVVCKYRPDWLCESIQGSLLPPGKLKVMSLEILTPTEVDICLYQNSTRGQGFLEPWNLWIIVVKCDPPSFVTKSDVVFSSPKSFIFQSNCTSQDCVSCTGWLDPGFYAVIPFSFLSWQDAIHLEDADELSVSVKSKAGRNRDYLLSVFSSRPLLLDKVGLLPGFTARAIYMLAKKIGRKSEFTKFACMYHVSVPRICRMAVVENRCNSHITVTTDASESYNIASTRGSLHTVDVLPPDHWQVLWAFSRPVETAAYALTLKMEYKLTPNNPEGKWGAVHTPSYPRHLQEFHQVYPIA